MSQPATPHGTPSFMAWPDLASRALAGSVVCANDELFAERENLIKPEPPVFSLHQFGPKGKVYDGWETRRRREPGHDWAIVRLGVPGIVHGVVVDTAWFKGNYPPHISAEAVAVDGYPSPAELEQVDWTTILGKVAASGDTANAYDVESAERWTHIRLSIYPDGGVARFRVHGEPRPDPRFLCGTIDLIALENGGGLVECSDAFYSSPSNLILPGRARSMGEGWENARRRGDGNDYAVFRLTGEGIVEHVEIDTSYFVGNAPGEVKLSGCQSPGVNPDERAEWFDVVAKQRSQPDTRHRFLPDSEPERSFTHVRLDVYPDGGLSRLRVWGHLTEAALSRLSPG
ncbi:MAG: allantoicase [Nocardioidaceae bacterium]|nr:allantoicase [Nocardioidaceae bacterium]